MVAVLAISPQSRPGGRRWTDMAHRWRWVILLLATAVAVVGFWAAGSDSDRFGGVGVLALPVYWAAGYLLSWRAVPSPPIALAAGIALVARAETADNEYAWMNYFGGLLLCEAAVVWGAVQRHNARTRAAIGSTPERPRR
jgi:hypothetical protein